MHHPMDLPRRLSPRARTRFHLRFHLLATTGLLTFCLLACLAILGAAGAQAATLTVTWYPNTEGDLAGYHVYYGTASGQYGSPVTVDAGTTTCQLTGLASSTKYYVALTAFNLAGFESGFSAEASATTFASTRYDLTTTASPTAGGTVSPSWGTYDSGTTVSVKATPAAGYKFDRWTGAVTGTTNPATVTMDANKTVTAYFVAAPTYTLTVSTSGSGSVAKSPSATSYASGTVVTLTATAAAGYKFDHWTGAITGTTNPATVTMDANKTVTAYFVAAPRP